MAPITQVECVTLKDGALAGGYDQEIAEFVVTSAPRATHFGSSIEKSSQLWTFIDWESPEILQSNQQESSYRSFTDRLAAFQDKSGFASTSHIALDATNVFNDRSNPTVEVLNMCFPSDIDEATRAAVEAQFSDFADKALRVPAMCGHFAQGWTTDNNVLLPGEEDGKTGRLYVSLISWPSVEKHMENRDTQAFKDSVHLLRGLPSLIKLDVFHVECRSLAGQTPRR